MRAWRLSWRLADGRYRLAIDEHAGCTTWLEVEEAALPVNSEKVFGVVTGPSSCGCEPAMFRWVGEREVEARRTVSDVCRRCSDKRKFIFADRKHVLPNWHIIYFHCDIIEVCGEADVARAVYEAEFADKIGALS